MASARLILLLLFSFSRISCSCRAVFFIRLIHPTFIITTWLINTSIYHISNIVNLDVSFERIHLYLNELRRVMLEYVLLYRKIESIACLNSPVIELIIQL